MTKLKLPLYDRRVTGAPVYDPAIAAPVLRLPAISHAEALAILSDRSVIDLMERVAAAEAARLHITGAKVTEISPLHFVAEASDLGLPPGVWPDAFTTDLGNGQRLVRVDLDDGRGLYRQSLGCIELAIYND